MRVTFDSNAWEKIFDPADRAWASIRVALLGGRLKGFICEAGFRIEAIRKSERAAYFAKPAFEVTFPGSIVIKDGKEYLLLASMGPDDTRHPGLPDLQSRKLEAALAAGVLLLRGVAWMGLPGPQQIRDPALFARTVNDNEREQRQVDILTRINARGVGKAAFDAAGGWALDLAKPGDEKHLSVACSEWADGELVAAHIAYQNDILCTEDRARSAGVSIFDLANRTWLTNKLGVRIMNLRELTEQITI